MTLNSLYYRIRPFIPRPIQISLRRAIVNRKRPLYADVWPIDEHAKTPPPGWKGWPDGKKFAFVITHDVETIKGVDRCLQLAAIDREYGFRSSFNFVAEDYEVPKGIRESLMRDGFEIGLHGLSHKGNLYASREKFEQDANRINEYLKEWDVAGFRTPSMYHNLDWLKSLNIVYDASTFDTDPFEPQSDGLGTIFPKWVGANGSGKGYLELPYTLPQDFMLFVVMQEKSADIWKTKLDWIVKHGGMALLIVHPDYVNLNGNHTSVEFPVSLYKEFLAYVRDGFAGQYWNVLPKDLAHHCGSSMSKSPKTTAGVKEVIEIDPSTDSRWDAFVQSHPFGWICHHSGWKEVIESSFGHMKGHYLAVVNGTGQITAGLPIYEVRSWLTGDRLVSIPFATLSDPLVSGENEMKMLLDAAIELSQKVGIREVEVRSLHSQDLMTDPRLSRECFFQHHYLRLGDDVESLKASFHLSCRRNINRARRNGLTLCVSDDEEGLQTFYALHVKTRRRLGLPPQPYRFFQALWNVFLPRDMITLLLAKHEDEVIAGQLYFKFRERVSMEFEAWNKDRHSLSPNHFIIWEAIRLFQSEGYKTLDFGRTSVTNVPLMLFKGRWGTRAIDLPTFLYPSRGHTDQRHNEDTLSYKVVRQTCKRAPEWALASIGEFCYRHLG